MQKLSWWVVVLVVLSACPPGKVVSGSLLDGSVACVNIGASCKPMTTTCCGNSTVCAPDLAGEDVCCTPDGVAPTQQGNCCSQSGLDANGNCSDGSVLPDSGCTPGASTACTCTNGQTGAQVCSAAGVYGACTCAPAADGGTDGGSDAGLDAGSGPCATNADCTSVVGTLCDVSTGACVECLQPSDCSYTDPGCHLGTCGFCADSSECVSGQACNSGVCQCQGNTGCGGSTPVCGDAGICECTASSDCGTGEILRQPQLRVRQLRTQLPAGCRCLRFRQRDGLQQRRHLRALSIERRVRRRRNGRLLHGAGLRSVHDRFAMHGPGCGHALLLHICVQCVTAADCPSTNRGCNGATATCGSCIFNGDCPSTYGCLLQGTSGGVCAPICTSVDAGACAACESSGDCSGGKQCNLTTGICS